MKKYYPIVPVERVSTNYLYSLVSPPSHTAHPQSVRLLLAILFISFVVDMIVVIVVYDGLIDAVPLE